MVGCWEGTDAADGTVSTAFPLAGVMAGSANWLAGEVQASALVVKLQIPAAGAGPRVKPDSVTVTEPIPVGAPAVVMMIWVLVAVTAAA